MAESQCIRIPLVAEHADAFAAWLRSLAARPEELRAVLVHEGMLAELIFLERKGAEATLVIYTRAASLKSVDDAYASSTHPIDLEMKKWETIAFRAADISTLEVLFEHGQPE